MNDTNSQVNRLAEHFKQGGSVTSYEAYVNFGITQLAARITELEARGMVLRRTPEKTTASVMCVIRWGMWHEHDING